MSTTALSSIMSITTALSSTSSTAPSSTMLNTTLSSTISATNTSSNPVPSSSLCTSNDNAGGVVSPVWLPHPNCAASLCINSSQIFSQCCLGGSVAQYPYDNQSSNAGQGVYCVLSNTTDEAFNICARNLGLIGGIGCDLGKSNAAARDVVEFGTWSGMVLVWTVLVVCLAM